MDMPDDDPFTNFDDETNQLVFGDYGEKFHNLSKHLIKNPLVKKEDKLDFLQSFSLFLLKEIALYTHEKFNEETIKDYKILFAHPKALEYFQHFDQMLSQLDIDLDKDQDILARMMAALLYSIKPSL